MKTALEMYHKDSYDLADMLREVSDWMWKLPDPPAGVEPSGLWSCHTLVRGVRSRWEHRLQGWKVVDGFFMRRGIQHSWLSKETLIIDVYPVATVGGPLLLDPGWMGPWADVYIPAPERYADEQDIFRKRCLEILAMVCPT